MTNTKKLWLSTSAAVLAAALAGPALPSSASASPANLPLMLQDARTSDSVQVISSDKLYRMQQRPWARVPTGARVLVRAPAGMTAADLHRAASCTGSETSPFCVDGAKVEVRRIGDMYELRITADQRNAALEIQRRVTAL